MASGGRSDHGGGSGGSKGRKRSGLSKRSMKANRAAMRRQVKASLKLLKLLADRTKASR